MMRQTIPADELLSKAHSVGQYYGFMPLSTLTEARARTRGGVVPYPESLARVALDPVAETVASFLKQCRNAGCSPSARQPLFVWHTNLAPGRAAKKKAVVQFHALGADRALADVVVIRAIIALVRDLFREEPVVRVNSMGDKETRARYARELATFFKKRADTLTEEVAELARRNVIEAAELLASTGVGPDSGGRAYAEELPAPTEHLSDASRKRFEDLLEYLEMTETPYELARNLVSSSAAWHETCFEIVVGERRIAWGSRYGELARHFFPGTQANAICAVLQTASDGAIVKNVPKPRFRFSFIHIGDEAKRASLRLAEEFKRARVPLEQRIGTESLAEQISLAEARNNPYLLIMGRKEALEGSATLRNRHTQEETVLPLAGIVERLKSFA